MTPFRHYRPTTLSDALAAAAQPGARIIAGGTNLVDHMKLGIETPSLLIDITAIAELNTNSDTPDGGLRIGAMVRNTDIAAHARVKRDYGVLSRAIVSGASGQVRNMASAGGNLLQRTRCPYFYDPNMPCNKRKPGSGCAAQGGFSRNHAAVGGSALCICAFPSDMSVALNVLDARVEVARADGSRRTIPIADFHLAPGDELPVKEFALAHGEIVTALLLPPPPGGRHIYRKVRERASFAFALVSVAAVLQADGSGKVALGGVGTRPWRNAAADAALPKGAKAVVEALFPDATPQPDNAYKLVLAERTIAAVLAAAKGARS
jgi:xanthine dehydrogenase YagS FAD-binding subunit